MVLLAESLPIFVNVVMLGKVVEILMSSLTNWRVQFALSNKS